VARLAYHEAVRGLDGQTTDLENIRSHVNVAVTLGGVAAGVFVAKGDDIRGASIWTAFLFLALLIACAVAAYSPLIPFRFSSLDDRAGSVRRTNPVIRFFQRAFYKDSLKTAALPTMSDGREYETMMPSTAHLIMAHRAMEGYRANEPLLQRRWRCHNLALAALVGEVTALVVHAAHF
jgi:hypothetical protein